MKMVRKSLFLAVAVQCFGLVATVAQAADGFEPTPTFVVESRTALGVMPRDVIVNDGVAYVLGDNADGLSTIEMRDAATLELLESVSVKVVIQDIAADRRTQAIYAIGQVDGATRFQVLDAGLKPLGSTIIKPAVAYPSVTTADKGLVVVAGIRTESVDGFFGAVDVSQPARPVMREDFFASNARRGVLTGWLDADYGAIFLNASWDSQLAAVATGKSYVMSEFGVETASGSLSEPYAVAAVLEGDACEFGQPTSFLVADMTRNVLSLVDFDGAFQSLDMLAVVEFSLTQTGGSTERLAGTSMRAPVGLVATSCDQSVILLGSKNSNEIAQFARNQNLSSLERIGTIRLPARATAIAIDREADFAIAVSAENRAIMRLGNATTQAPVARIIGNEDVRELQRTLTDIGIPVGSIDGIIGAKTQRAVNLAERKFGVEIDTNKDIKKAIDALKGVNPFK